MFQLPPNDNEDGAVPDALPAFLLLSVSGQYGIVHSLGKGHKSLREMLLALWWPFPVFVQDLGFMSTCRLSKLADHCTYLTRPRD